MGITKLAGAQSGMRNRMTSTMAPEKKQQIPSGFLSGDQSLSSFPPSRLVATSKLEAENPASARQAVAGSGLRGAQGRPGRDSVEGETWDVGHGPKGGGVGGGGLGGT